MSKRGIFILFLLFMGFTVSGQKIVPTPAELYVDATEFIYSGDYYDALLILVSLESKGYNTANINYLIGECYLNIQGQKTKSIPFLKAAVQQISARYSGATIEEESAPVKSLLYLGIAYRLNYEFDDAVKCFNDYIRSLDDTDRDNLRLAEFHMERCNHARELMESPAKFTADTLDISLSAAASNFNAIVTADEKVLYYVHQFKFYDAVMRTSRNDAFWQAPENLTPLIKSDGDHYITGMSSDGNQIFLTSYDPYQTGELYTTWVKNNVWSPMLKLNSNVNTRFNETHATLSPDSRTLYFTSDRKGGYGGTDIYKSVLLDNGEWDKPVNLGPLINSPFNEESPFVTPDGRKLFFSSQGHYNMGGYDVFYSALGNDDKWLPPVNIGYPLNTTDDDLFFFPLDTGNIAYQSKYAKNSATSDVVRYNIDAYGNPARFAVNGKIDFDNEGDADPTSVTVSFINKHNRDTLASKRLNDDGSFRQKLAGGNYLVNISHKNSQLFSKDLVIPAYFPHNNLVFHEHITLPTVKAADTVFIGPVLFDFDKSSLHEDFLRQLDALKTLMNRYPEIHVLLNGYTDALGSESYNMKLSLRRAAAVKDYLAGSNEVSQRVEVRAFGESNPVAVNISPDGKDSPEGRKFNRRVEIEIVNSPDTIVIVNVVNIPDSVIKK